jgi:hypothetical protein
VASVRQSGLSMGAKIAIWAGIAGGIALAVFMSYVRTASKS